MAISLLKHSFGEGGPAEAVTSDASSDDRKGRAEEIAFCSFEIRDPRSEIRDPRSEIFRLSSFVSVLFMVLLSFILEEISHGRLPADI